MRGIFKSLDGGLTWEKKDNGIIESQGITFRGFSIDPTNSDIVYAAAELSSYVWNNGQEKQGREFDMTAGVVYKTTDGGYELESHLAGRKPGALYLDQPSEYQRVVCLYGIFDREAKNSDAATGDPGGEGVLKSTDGGETWTRANNGLKNLYVGSLFMHPTNPDILLAGTGNNAYLQDRGAYLTVDGGANWKQVLVDDTITSVEFATSDPSIAFAASADSVYRSEDGGMSWKRVGNGGMDITSTAPGDLPKWGAPGARGGFPIDLQVDPRDPDRLFANAYGGGNFLSEDSGETWSDVSRGYTGAQVRAIVVDPGQPGRVIAAARSGLFVSSDGGTNWQGLNYPPMDRTEWNAVALDPSDTTHIVAGSNNNSVLANSKTAGFQWNIPFDLDGQRTGWKAVIFAPSNNNVVYAASAGFYSAGSFDTKQPGEGIFISRDGGTTWSAANDALSEDSHVAALAVDPRNDQVVYAATANHGLLKTVDGGKSWQRVPGGLPEDSASAIAINPANPDLIFAGFNRKSLYISNDGGVTWEASGRGMMPEASFSSIVFDPTDPQNTVYAADLSNGVFRSNNAGKTWQLINTGLTMRSINALAISADGLHLYAASEGGGVFRLDLNGEPPAPAPTPETALAQNTTAPPQVKATGEPPISGDTSPSPLTPTTDAGSGLSLSTGILLGAALVLFVVIVSLFRFQYRR